ncbi:DUF551 domain-containing protein, partial [Providencia rettgeri]
MQGTNPTEFEKWCADEMGHTVEYMVMQRNKNILGGTVYKNEEIDKRYRAWRASWRERAKAFINGQWVKCSDKMPETDVRVMAVWNGMPTILCLFSRTGLWDDGDFYSCIPLEDVTHWMPLPP